MLIDAQVFGEHKKEGRHQWVFTYHLGGDLRFISHDNTLRLFRRALARAALPVRFSEGYSPLPHISLPLPRPVGIASDAECVVIAFEGEIDPNDTLRRLEEQTPAGIRMLDGRPLGPGERLQYALVRYRLEPDEPLAPDVETRVGGILSASAIQVQRTRHSDKKTKTIDIRPYLAILQVDGDAIQFVLRVTPDGTAKPAEIARLLGYDERAINHRIRRMEVQWQ